MLRDDLNKAKNMYSMSEFSRPYTFTTENISGYLEYFDLKDKSLLTVDSSGDQVIIKGLEI